MRKFIPIIFIFVFCSNVSLAAISCTATAVAECEVGCYVTTGAGCRSCNVGTYTSTAGSTSCSPCIGPSGATFRTAGTSNTGCTWTIVCYPGNHYDSTTKGCKQCTDNTFTDKPIDITGTGYGNTTSCFQCGANSTVNGSHTNCNCNQGYHTKGKTNNDTTGNGTTECVINTYTITYMSDANDGSTQTQSITHGQSVTLKGASTFTKTGYNLSEWVLKNSSTTYTPGATISDGFTSDITLIAGWSAKEFTVTYNVNGATNCGLSNQGCTYGKSGCTAPDVKNCTYTGHTFGGWSCTGCNSGVGTITIGKDISTLSNGNNMTLKANWDPCPAGYYCTDLTKNPCPAGSTSDVGKSAKTHCYMTGGTTTICDINNKCFTLPGTNKIYYHDGK